MVSSDDVILIVHLVMVHDWTDDSQADITPSPVNDGAHPSPPKQMAIKFVMSWTGLG